MVEISEGNESLSDWSVLQDGERDGRTRMDRVRDGLRNGKGVTERTCNGDARNRVLEVDRLGDRQWKRVPWTWKVEVKLVLEKTLSETSIGEVCHGRYNGPLSST